MVFDVLRPASQGCRQIFVFGLTVLLLLNQQVCFSLDLDYFYPFNTTTDRSTPKKDDGGSGKIEIAVDFNFFDRAYNTVYVSNNGIISFNTEFSDRYQPQSFPINGTALVAPFWADVDIEKLPGGEVFYGEYTDSATLQRATCDIRTHKPEYDAFKATWVFVSTWFQVGYYGADGDGKNKRNTFQAVLISDGSLAFVMFNYNRIEWTTGKNSEGNITTGLGGEPAQAGYNAGCCNKSEDVPGSATEDVINLTTSTNVDLPGRQLFELSDKVITTTTPVIKQKENIKVEPSSGSMLGGERLVVEGVCFPICCTLLRGQYVEWNITFTCVRENWQRAECVLPPVFNMGIVTLRFTVMPNSNCDQTFCGKNFEVSTNFSIYNFIRAPAKVKREKPDRWDTGSAVSITWKQSEFSSTNIYASVLGYTSSPPSWEFIPNSINCTTGSRGQSPIGQCWIFNLKMDSSYNTAIVRVSQYRGSPECKHTKNVYNCTVKAIHSDIFAVNSGKVGYSRDWCEKWMNSEAQLPDLLAHQACPTTYTLAKNDIANFQVDPFCDSSAKSLKPSCLYIRKVKACFRLVSPLENGGDQVCCYGEDGDLKSADELYGWGTRQRYHFEGSNSVPTLDTFEKDILPSLHCRYYSSDDELLKWRYEMLRPKSTTQGYTPPKPAQCAGDPHIVTLDGKKYTFNGIGEYVFMQDPGRQCVIQIRTAQARDIFQKEQRASIIDAVVMGGSGKPAIEVRRVTAQSQLAEVYINGQILDISSTQDKHIGGLTLSVKTTKSKITSVLIVFDKEGLSVEIEATPYLLNVLLIVGSQLKGKLEGLLGNFNDKPDDDFTARNGFQLSSKPTDQEIHEKFGLSWAITMNESLFAYAAGESTENFTNHSFKPYFLDDLIDQFNETEIKICGRENTECLFDLKTTKNEEIANTTKKFVKMFEDIVKETKAVVRCVFPPDYSNTTKNVTGLKVNDVVSYSCLNNAQEMTKVCQPDGTWSNNEVSCEEVEHKRDYQMIIVASASTAGSVFLISITVIIIYVCSQKRKKKAKPITEMVDMEEFPNSSMFTNDEFLKQLQELTQDGSFKLPRPFLEDRSLYTEYF